MLLSYFADLVSLLGDWGGRQASTPFSEQCRHPEADREQPRGDNLPAGGDAHTLPKLRLGQERAVDPPFDPRDHDWTSPSDEDRPWEFTPRIPLGISVDQGKQGERDAITRAVQEQVGPFEYENGCTDEMLAREGGNRESAPACPICFTNDAHEDVQFRCNAHFFCEECIGRYLRQRIAAGSVPRCPADGCRAEADPRLCERVLGPQEYDQYLMVYLRAIQRLQNCPSCGTGVLLEGRTPRESASSTDNCSSARCPTCMHRFCVVCGLLWHPMSSCEEAIGRSRRRRQREASRTFEDVSGALGFQRCPRCGVSCEKSTPSACDHMTCTICNFEFCWSCMADRRVIYAHGNHYHFPSCQHYREYRGEAEYEPKCPRCKSRGRPCTPPSLRPAQQRGVRA